MDRRGATRDDELLQRAAVQVLHRDVVRALRLAAVVDRDDVGMRETCRVLRLAAETLDELIVARVPVVEDLDRDAPAEHLVLGEIDVRHPARAELPQDAIAPVEERVDQGVGDRHWGLSRVGIRPYRSSASITCFAMGAEIVPPKPLSWCSTTTAMATRGASAGAKAANQVVWMLPRPTSAVPVLPATLTPGMAAAGPVPPVTTSSIMRVSSSAVWRLIGRPS